MHCDATGMYEKEIEADSEQTRLGDERALTQF